jgi:hypothetical protein
MIARPTTGEEVVENVKEVVGFWREESGGYPGGEPDVVVLGVEDYELLGRPVEVEGMRVEVKET